MDKQALIQAILRSANEDHLNAQAIVSPLNRFGTAWWDGGEWWFSEQIAEIGVYRANGGSISRFGEGQFEVKQPTPEQIQEAVDAWNSGEIYRHEGGQ